MLISLPSVQLEPLYDSEFATVDPVLPAAATAAVCEPKPPVPLLAVFNEPPLAQVELGIPAAFPKAIHDVPPDKKIIPSFNFACVTGGKDHSSLVA